MPGDLKNERPVSPFIEQLAFRQRPDGETAKDKRSRAKAQILSSLLSVLSNQSDGLGLPESVFGDDQFRMILFQAEAGLLQPPFPMSAAGAYTVEKCVVQRLTSRDRRAKS